MDCHIAPLVGIYGEITEYLFLLPRSKTGSRPGGKRALERVESGYLDWALKEFSGYIAADEVYDGPFCILSMVDNHNFKRLFYEVLDHSPSQADVITFFQRAKRHLDQRGLATLGITTDGSQLYPGAIDSVLGQIPHQVCQFHIIKDITGAILRAVAKERKRLTALLPKLPRGRPSKSRRALVRRIKRQQDKISDLFTHRHLFVQRSLSPADQRLFIHITRGLPHLRTLRQIMDLVYGLFDRRCCTATALAKLTRLRNRLKRFKHLHKTLQPLFSPNTETALTFLDDKLLPSTSNAVERSNRRFRKMQKSIYSVRTLASVKLRIALDMIRDEFAPSRATTTRFLHAHRNSFRTRYG